MSRDKIRPEDLPAGKRRLAELVVGAIRYYPSEAVAQKAWADMARKKFDYTVERITSVVKIDYVHEEDKGYFIRGVLHPACFHFMRPMQDLGIQVEIGTTELNWEVQPPRTLEELAMMPKGVGGRYWV